VSRSVERQRQVANDLAKAIRDPPALRAMLPWGQLGSKHAEWDAHNATAASMHAGSLGQVGQESNLRPAVWSPFRTFYCWQRPSKYPLEFRIQTGESSIDVNTYAQVADTLADTVTRRLSYFRS
jgi:hypothetical protein